MEFNDVSCPSHYCEGRLFEPIKVINDWQLDFDLGNVVKYISRAGRKDDKLKDLEKAQFYLNYAIDKEQKKIKKDRIIKDKIINSTTYDSYKCGPVVAIDSYNCKPIEIDTSHTSLCYKEKI